MAAEQASTRAHADGARLGEALAQLAAAAAAQSSLAAERDRLAVTAQHYAQLKQKYVQKSTMLKEALARCAAKETENAELVAMCDQLLQQQEARRTGEGGGGSQS
ncbi:hypothetical protein MNEG_1896 [Monoraphidium neglectum]|uniref:Uncharacterized protein n=1 Tax=Monoraphidium neglectum TaxID=145388 RepID=A0A0D2MU24_9CHLO|nr:hypothetical protein MNEG_1896 [Monoraphidium neglectum]KIZ06065.1 hypothetical protein MNEG_1896 [Monoraphidium neglectum]|eukprot:XP_013905084.1 hypothetical protein MNEG_1896 [Monoraphidium neglectum]